jgi:hypothetical protein
LKEFALNLSGLGVVRAGFQEQEKPAFLSTNMI